MKKSVLDPMHPERVCWGCERYCAANDLACGNGSIRTPHPRELFGDDWLEWTPDSGAAPEAPPMTPVIPPARVDGQD